ncbi:hypothetical protein ABRZ04_12905 [Castellaniella ginsengisoli]|uniref:Uncharacterized protein n=1 Tax=Castellaniella ginsengisoli TaxID=546114 RepID=A0AB39CZE6_9BURK
MPRAPAGLRVVTAKEQRQASDCHHEAEKKQKPQECHSHVGASKTIFVRHPEMSSVYRKALISKDFPMNF